MVVRRTESVDLKRSFVLNGFSLLIGCFLLMFAQKSSAQDHELIIKFKGADAQTTSKIGQKSSSILSRLQQRFGSYQQHKLIPQSSSQLQKKSIHPFQNVVVLHFEKAVVTQSLVDSLNSMPQIEYACRNHAFRVEQSSSDPDYEKQWGMEKIHIQDAWKQTQGSQAVPIVLIDTGIDMQHEDLQNQVWINPGEDLNGNSRDDLTDLNGIDDDGNGYIDDIAGWDFVDASRYPDGGDYLDPDNDPSDEHGHGTAMAGIMAAQANNGLGIAGVAPNCRVVNLRAGTSKGVLEEDDVAAAIIYAVDMKFRIINMSFGDVLITRLLRDVIQYAYRNGVVMVSSSGNNGDDQIHYPSGLTETISVGASSQADYRAGFSSFGSSLDLLAPGVGIYTTLMQNDYGEVSGTSAAAPFVSAVAALLLSLDPNMNVEVIRSRILQSCDDVHEPKWDFESGAGRLRADAAVMMMREAVVQIHSPEQDQGFAASTIPVIATCAGSLVSGYELSVGTGSNPVDWQNLVTQTDHQIVQDTICHWPVPAAADTTYTLRLRANLRNGQFQDDYCTVYVDNTPPIVQDFQYVPVLTGSDNDFLLNFDTDDFTTVEIHFRPAASNVEFDTHTFPFQNNHHAWLLSQPQSNMIEYYLTLTNRSGLSSQYPESLLYAQMEMVEIEPVVEEFKPEPAQLNSGYLLNKATDFDLNGSFEIVMNEYTAGQNFGNLVYWEYQDNQFQPILDTGYSVIPRDFGDVNHDGRAELLAGAGKASLILAAKNGSKFPNTIVWLDTNDTWASRLYDFNADGYPELLAKNGNLWHLWHNNRDYSFEAELDIPNPTDGENGTGVPHVEIADYDGDNRPELLFGDYDGDVYMYQMNSDFQAVWEWQDRLLLIDTIDFLTTGDFDGDGIPEFAVGCHSSQELDLEHNFDDRHWLFRIYKYVGQESKYQVVWQQRFYGFYPPQDFDSGISAGDVNGDKKDDLLISIYPNLYLVAYDSMAALYQVRTYHQPVRSNVALVHDFNMDGRNEVIWNDGQQCQMFSYNDGQVNPPDFPVQVKAVALDSDRVQLTWQSSAGLNNFRIYRGSHPDSLNPIQSGWTNPDYMDSSLTVDQTYYYQIAQIRNDGGESLSDIVSTTPHYPARISVLRLLIPDQIVLKFTLPMGESTRNEKNYVLQSNSRSPQTAAQNSTLKEVILSWSPSNPISPQDTLLIHHLRDKWGTPLDRRDQKIFYQTTAAEQPPYIVRAEFRSSRLLEVEFSTTMEYESVIQPENYRLEPGIPVQSLKVSGPQNRIVELELKDVRPVGPVGVQYDLYIQNVRSQAGVELNQQVGYHVSFVFRAENLNQVYVYPNPAHNQVTFARLTPQATIELFTSSGVLVRRLQIESQNGGFEWDLQNGDGLPVPSGVYMYRVSNKQESHWGKLVVVR